MEVIFQWHKHIETSIRLYITSMERFSLLKIM